MERLSPCARLHDILESQGDLEDFRGHNPQLLQELNLDVSTGEFVSAARAFTYEDLYAVLGNRNTIAWLTPHTAVARNSEYGIAVVAWVRLNESCSFCFSANGREDIAALASSTEHFVEICNIVVRLLAASVVHSLILYNSNGYDTRCINATSLAYLMDQCQSLKVLSLKNQEMDEDIIRVLGDYSRPDLEIELNYCKFTGAGTGALAEILGCNQGPTKLNYCEIDNFVLADGLRGNISLKSLKLRFSSDLEVDNRELTWI
jgi:hypothetical protein